MSLILKSALALTAVAALGLAAAHPAAAQGLDGTSMTGSANFSGGSINYFDPANDNGTFYGVPAGFSNTAGPTVTVTEPQVEFGFKDGANLDSADFRDGQLILTDVTAKGQGAGPAVYTFTDSALGSVSELFDTFKGGLTYSLVGDTLTINTASFSPANGGTREAIFDITAAPAVPEASTTVSLGLLLALGMGGVVVSAKRKKAASAL